MNKLRKITSQLIAAVMLLTSMCTLIEPTASAEETNNEGYIENVTLFNADNKDLFKSRSMQDIADKYSEALYAAEGYNNSNPNTWYSEIPSLEAPYSPGMISEDARTSILAMTNFYRWLMGLNPVKENTENIESLQLSALIRNFDYNHFVDIENKPADMFDDMWNDGANCAPNILNNSTPQRAPTSWMNEGCIIFEVDEETGVLFETEQIKTVAHRSLITSIDLEEITFAQCGNVTAGTHKKNDVLHDKTIEFVAYPCPGYMPSMLVDPQRCAWSFELNPKYLYLKDESTDGVEVTITNLRTGEQFVEPVLLKYKDCLAFKQPTDYVQNGFGGTYSYVDNYRVEIEGIYAVNPDKSFDPDARDLPAKISYTVKFFDMDDCRPTRVVSTETFRIYSIPGEMMTDEGFKYISSILPDEISVCADNGRYYSVPIKGSWTVDMERSCFVTSAEAYKLPSHVSDPNNLMNEIIIPFEETIQGYAPYEWLQIDNSVNASTLKGNDVFFHAQTCNVDTDTMDIFRLVDLPDGNCVSIKMFEVNDVEGGDATVTLESAEPGDSGKYISVFYNQHYINTFNRTKCFVSNSVAELAVNMPCTCTTTESSSAGIHTSPISLGDLNFDESVNLLDVLYLQKHILGSVTLSDEQLANADVCKDSMINALDANVLLKYTVESIKSLPVIP